MPWLERNKPPSVIVVDDHQGMGEVLKDAILEPAGYRVDIFISPHAALRAIRRERYEVMVLDWSMAEMSGAETLASARKIDPNMAVVVFTGNRDFATAAIDAGADFYLIKPSSPSAIRGALEEALIKSRAGRK